MTTKSVRLPAGVDAREYAPKITPLLQVLLATLSDIDFAYESDLEVVGNSAVDEILKQKVIENIHLQHQEGREAYVRQITVLQHRLQAMAA